MWEGICLQKSLAEIRTECLKPMLRAFALVSSTPVFQLTRLATIVKDLATSTHSQILPVNFMTAKAMGFELCVQPCHITIERRISHNPFCKWQKTIAWITERGGGGMPRFVESNKYAL